MDKETKKENCQHLRTIWENNGTVGICEKCGDKKLYPTWEDHKDAKNRNYGCIPC